MTAEYRGLFMASKTKHQSDSARQSSSGKFLHDDVIQSSSSVSDGEIQKMLEFLNEKNITLEELLAQRNLASATPPPTTTTIAPSDHDLPNQPSDTVSLGLILPIGLIILFLLIVTACVYWHKWRGKRRLQGDATVPNLSLSTFSRTFPTGTDWQNDMRGSTRSTTPLRSVSRDKSTGHPAAYHNALSDSLSTSRSSCSTSAGTSFLRDEHGRHCHSRRQLSPIDEVAPYISKFMGNNVASVSQYEGCMSAHNVYSPYHLTWVSPQTMKAEDINNNNNRTTCETSFYRSAKSSPFYPNNNTPTKDPDTASGHISTPAIINPVTRSGPSSTNFVGNSYPPSDSTDTSLTDTSGGTAIGAISSLGYLGTGSRCQSDPGGRDSDSSSLPSSINPFRQRTGTQHAEQRHSMPNYNGAASHAAPFSEPLASSIDSYTSSDNTSLYPNVGSSVNTTAHPLSLPSNPISLPPSVPPTPRDRSRVEDPFDTAVSIVDGQPKTCLVHGDSASFASPSSSNIATTLFRSWSASAELDYGSYLPNDVVPSPMSAPTGTIAFVQRNQSGGEPRDSRVVVGAASHNNLDKSQVDARHVMFQNIPPVLDDKKYWL